ncbi:nucleoside/nucleotide kinase family protein [Actinoplanes sp. HUAS TT8]|uniref:nucleoside/nucleotide kinase family protein n=1 Tax=Actinoplanes sp. HUAS TT8 TaxID=3447453 RepID=UPI003F528110
MTTTFAALVDRARSLAGGRGRAVLGIAGAPAAGKTTLARHLVRALSEAGVAVAHVPMDGFHLADAELDRLGARDRKGAPDTFDALGYAALLRRLKEDADEMIYAPGFERTIEQPIAGTIPVPPAARLIISEGNYLLVDDPRWRPVRPQTDEIWYLDLDQEERLRRLVERHVRFGKPEADAIAWATGTDERNAEIIMATRNRADLIIPATVLDDIDAAPSADGRTPTRSGT